MRRWPLSRPRTRRLTRVARCSTRFIREPAFQVIRRREEEQSFSAAFAALPSRPSSRESRVRARRSTPFELRIKRFFSRLRVEGRSGSRNPYFVGGNPDVELVEALLERLFQTHEKRGVSRRVLHVNEESDVFLLLPGALVDPNGPQNLRLPSDGTELGGHLFRRRPVLCLFHRRAVVIPGGQDDFVASEGHYPDSPFQEE